MDLCVHAFRDVFHRVLHIQVHVFYHVLAPTSDVFHHGPCSRPAQFVHNKADTSIVSLVLRVKGKRQYCAGQDDCTLAPLVCNGVIHVCIIVWLGKHIAKPVSLMTNWP